MKLRSKLFLPVTLLLVCAFIAPDALFAIGRFLKEMATLIVLGK